MGKGNFRSVKKFKSNGDNLPKTCQITEIHQKFIEHYFKSGNISDTARELKLDYAKVRRWVKIPAIAEELQRLRDELRKKSGYTVQLAMDECHAAMEFAQETKNANALVKAIELKTRLNGLLVEKHDHRMIANFSIEIENVKDKKIKSSPVAESPQLSPPVENFDLPIDVTAVVKDEVKSVVEQKQTAGSLSEEDLLS